MRLKVNVYESANDTIEHPIAVFENVRDIQVQYDSIVLYGKTNHNVPYVKAVIPKTCFITSSLQSEEG